MNEQVGVMKVDGHPGKTENIPRQLEMDVRPVFVLCYDDAVLTQTIFPVLVLLQPFPGQEPQEHQFTGFSPVTSATTTYLKWCYIRRAVE